MSLFKREGYVAYIEVFRGQDGQFYFREKASNHETVGTSEGYTRHEDAVRAAQSKWSDPLIRNVDQNKTMRESN